MPHCVIEYSHNLAQEASPEDWMDAVYEACVASELFDTSDIKIRVLPYKYFKSGGVEDAFIHVDVKLLSGRTDEQKSRLADLVFERLRQSAIDLVSYSVDIIDMNRDHYRKKVTQS